MATATPIASHNGILLRLVPRPVICFTSSVQGREMYSPLKYAPQPHSLASDVGSNTPSGSLHLTCTMYAIVTRQNPLRCLSVSLPDTAGRATAERQVCVNE